jgi:cystathionine gamma-synthase
MKRKVGTTCIHGEKSKTKAEHFGAISYPIYQTATFAHPGVGQSTGYDYSRMQNPTREQLEKTVAALEEGAFGFAFSSGMAAIATMMELFQPGQHLLIDSDLYGGSIRLFEHISKKNGLQITALDFCQDDVVSHIQKNTVALYVETPTNPMMNITDLKKISEIAKKHKLLLLVDNTFLSPYFQNPLSLGADVVIHSGTKYLGGHNDTLAGFLVVNEEKIADQIRFLMKTTGAALAPMDSWLILRGIKTLAIRMERAQENAICLSKWLGEQSHVRKVLYPGLPEHKGHEIMKKQSRGFGAMVSFEVDSKETAFFILEKVQLIQYAESLGGVETLITYPITQTHADVPKALQEKNGITDCLLRLSVGIEDISDLIQDLGQVFRKLEQR